MSTEEPPREAPPEAQAEPEQAPEGALQPRRRGFRTGRLEAFSDGVFAIGVTLLVLWRYAVRAHLVRPDTADEEIELLTQRLTPGLSAYVVLIVSGLFLPVIAVIGFLGIALYYIIPFRRLSASILPRHRRRKRH